MVINGLLLLLRVNQDYALMIIFIRMRVFLFVVVSKGVGVKSDQDTCACDLVCLCKKTERGGSKGGSMNNC